MSRVATSVVIAVLTALGLGSLAPREGQAQSVAADAEDAAASGPAVPTAASPSAPLVEFSVLVNRADHLELYLAASRQINNFAKKTNEADGQTARWVRVAKDSDGEDKLQDAGGDTLSRVNNGVTPPVRELLVFVFPEHEQLTSRDFTSVGIQDVFDDDGSVFDRTILFTMSERGQGRLHDITFKYQPDLTSSSKRCLAIIVRDEIQSAPTINDVISGGTGQISGQFTEAELQDLIASFREAGVGPIAETSSLRGPFGWTLTERSVQFTAAIFVIALLGFVLCVRRAKPEPRPATELLDQESVDNPQSPP